MTRLLVLAFAIAACGTDVQGFSGDAGVSPGTVDSAVGGDLPCDVAAVLEAHCWTCHGNPPAGAPMSLVSYGDLVATSPLGGSFAHRAYVRMTDPMSPMPPGAGVTVPAADLATFKAWLDAGMPSGTCTTAPDPLNAPPACTSNMFWTQGNHGSALMHPGAACIMCHAQEGEAPRFTVAGTVYPTGHEPTDCDGTMAAQVVITDSAGKTVTLVPNAAGNFRTNTTLVFPIHAKVVANGKERVMAAAQTSGDCNVCHTQSGAMMAPGRVTLPP